MDFSVRGLYGLHTDHKSVLTARLLPERSTRVERMRG
nr:MAG TPA: hypothetical protein [Caudoviricetes sp.]